MSATDESSSNPGDNVCPVDININSNSNSNSTSSTRLTGRVKWFNNKTGFGFITALGDSEGVKEGSDVFVHHSTIKVAQEQYRYLVQGEYVEFVLSKIADASNKHEFQAADVSGVKGGKLICETRWESRTMSGGGGSSESRFKRTSDGLGGGWKTVKGSNATSIFAPRQSGTEWRRGDSSRSSRGRGREGSDTN
jgi:cold shock CspA family protein